MGRDRVQSDGEIWVFGYGSLMWNPGFSYVDARPADLLGYHRVFCLYSDHYRGTPEHRGLVLGLDRGGSCCGRAFRVGAAEAKATMDYLIKREMFGHEVDVYELRWLGVALGDSGEAAQAACFVINPAHDHYAGQLSPEEISQIIASASGRSVTNREYLSNTIAHLEELGIADGPLHEVHRLVGS
jgi:cation transport protein ChaC